MELLATSPWAVVMASRSVAALVGGQRARGDGLRDPPVLALQPERLQARPVGPLVLGDAGTVHRRDGLEMLVPVAVADADDHHGHDGHGQGDEGEGDPALEPLLGVEGAAMRGRAATGLLVGRHALLRRDVMLGPGPGA